MSDKLLIVESPTKAKTIGKMLGDDYKILASMGHIRDLPEKSFGVDIENDFTPLYTDNPKSKKIVGELRSAAKKAKEIYLAPDPDREGEAIAWHLKEVLQPNFKGEFKRVTFHEITASAINKALENSSDINQNLVDSQQARRVLDRIVGYMVSPLLWSKISKGISAGRVQSVALRLVVERERSILAFEPEEYWNFILTMKTADGDVFESRLFKINGKDLKISSQKEAEAVLEDIKNQPFEISKITESDRKRYASAPFTTSTLQQAANNNLHYSASSTMRYAQQLYEGIDLGDGNQVGLITYMRTDSVNVAMEAKEACKNFILNHYGAEYAPGKFNFFKSKGITQDAHEAIRPTDVTRTPESLAKVLDASQLKLYTLIWKRFVASQMSPALSRQMTLDITAKGHSQTSYTCRANGSIMLFPGFTKVYNDQTDGDDNSGALDLFRRRKEHEICEVADIKDEQKFTEPPPRYTEASLIKELEENGVGRPSTYAAILKTIMLRDYVKKEQNKLSPTPLGCSIIDYLLEVMPEMFEVSFTSDMEKELDGIEEGNIKWTLMLRDFYDKFVPWLNQAKNAGAPAGEKTLAVLGLFEKIEFLPPEKHGRRTYDDKKFFTSIQKAFNTKNTISAKQYDFLLDLAVKYQDQIPALNEVAEKFTFADELAEARKRVAIMQDKAIQSTANNEQTAQYQMIFDGFAKVVWDEPQLRRGRTYDDKKFFKSLKTQIDGGKILSEKQLAALVKLFDKYKETILDYEKIKPVIAELTPVTENSENAAPAPDNTEVKALLETLSAVTQWNEPVKRGRRTYDDQAFFKSLSDQCAQGRTLSDKQVAALKKLVTKYQAKESE